MALIGPPRELPESTGSGPAVAFGAPEILLIAWSTKTDTWVQRRINLMWQPKGHPYTEHVTRMWDYRPALAFFNGHYYLAHGLQLFRSADGVEWKDDMYVIDESSCSGAALAVFQNRLYMSWCGADSRINVFDTTSGDHWADDKVALQVRSQPERSQSTPALASNGKQLLIAFRGVGNDRIVVVRGNGKVFDDKVVLEERTGESPAIVSRGAELILAWQGVPNNFLNTLVSTDGGATWGNRVTAPYYPAVYGPALAANESEAEIAWTGTDKKHFLNLAILGL